MSVSTLYICYFSLHEPLVQTQVLPYLRQLAADGGVEVYLLTFEPQFGQRWNADRLESESARMNADRIRWFCLPYHKKPSALATLYDIGRGAQFAARLVRRYNIKVIHARSHVPMAMAMLIQRRVSCRVVFDFRGLMAEEYVGAGIWRENSPPFRAVKKVEQAGLRRADRIIVLTHRMRSLMAEQKLADAEKIEVIPCCVDFTRFNASENLSATATDGFEVIYAGSVAGRYLLEQMAGFFLEIRTRQPGAFFRILTTAPPSDVAATLHHLGLRSEEFWVGAVKPDEVPAHLRRARLGLCFLKTTPAEIASSPTKIPEYLAAGLPVVATAGIGDTDSLLESEKVGVVLKAFDAEAYANAARQAMTLTNDPDTAARCVRVACRHFDLITVGGAGYRRVYRSLDEEERLGLATTQASSS